MSDWTKEQRAIAAAHLCDIAAKALREGLNFERAEKVCLQARSLSGVLYAETIYRAGLRFAGLSPDDIDAAGAAISLGEHPPDSLPGRVSRYEDEAETAGVDAANLAEPDYDTGRAQGKCDAAAWLLTLLGCEVPK